jgi:hypothetical protein
MFMARYGFLSFASLGVLAACANGAGLPQPDITFDHLQPMPVNVAHVETEVLGGSEADGFAISPSEAAERYLSSRFNAMGNGGTLRAVMEEATVRHVYSPSKGRMTGYLNVAGHDIYDVKLILRLEHISESGTVLYGNTLKAQRTMNITEHASVAEREQHQLEGIEQLYADLDRQVVRVVLTDMRLGTR